MSWIFAAILLIVNLFLIVSLVRIQRTINTWKEVLQIYEDANKKNIHTIGILNEGIRLLSEDQLR